MQSTRIADDYRRTPIGLLYRLIWSYIQQILGPLDRRFTKGRVIRSVSRLGQDVVNEKRPTLLLRHHPLNTSCRQNLLKIFFLSFLSGSATLFIPATWPLVSWNHKLSITLFLPLPYIFAYLCNKPGPDAPHIISPASYAQNASRYPYDYKLFHPNINHKTCQFPKPARSNKSTPRRAARGTFMSESVMNATAMTKHIARLTQPETTSSSTTFDSSLTYQPF
jgi:palmitoyltransferase